MNRLSMTVVFGVFALAGAAQADVTTTDPYLYGQGRYYQCDSPAHFAGFFDIFVDLDMVGPPIYGPALPGTTEIRESPTWPRMTVSLNGLPPGEPVFGSLIHPPIRTQNIGSTGQDGVSFEIEMLALDLVGAGLPPGVMIRESPTLQSTGQTHITNLGAGQFRINSFFDVFTELSIDGGQTWLPASGPMHMSLIPTPGVAALLGLGGLAAMRRRR